MVFPFVDSRGVLWFGVCGGGVCRGVSFSGGEFPWLVWEEKDGPRVVGWFVSERDVVLFMLLWAVAQLDDRLAPVEGVEPVRVNGITQNAASLKKMTVMLPREVDPFVRIVDEVTGQVVVVLVADFARVSRWYCFTPIFAAKSLYAEERFSFEELNEEIKVLAYRALRFPYNYAQVELVGVGGLAEG